MGGGDSRRGDKFKNTQRHFEKMEKKDEKRQNESNRKQWQADKSNHITGNEQYLAPELNSKWGARNAKKSEKQIIDRDRQNYHNGSDDLARKRNKILAKYLTTFCEKDQQMKQIITDSIASSKYYNQPAIPTSKLSSKCEQTEISFVCSDINDFIITCPKIENEKVGVLVHASAKNIGGGFPTGAKAQEEDICHHSTMYQTLSGISEDKKFYGMNNSNPRNGIYHNAGIFSDVVFFPVKLPTKPYKFNQDDQESDDESDSDEEIDYVITSYNSKEPNYNNDRTIRGVSYGNNVPCSVIVCPAVNAGVARKYGITENDILKEMYKRINLVLHIAADNNIDHLILGPFGCNVFKNSIEYVMKIFYEHIHGRYQNVFKKITFVSMKEDTVDTMKSEFTSLPKGSMICK